MHFSVLTLFTNKRLSRRFRRCPGRLLCGGESGCSSRKALPGPKSYAPSTSSSSCWSGLLRIYHRRSERETQTGKTHDICICSFFFTIDTSGRARGCCAGVLRRRAGCGGVLEARVGCTSSQDTPQTRCFTFVWHHSVMRDVISLRFTRVVRCVLQDMSRRTTQCCLSFNDSQAIPLLATASALGLLEEVRVMYTIFARHKP